jgi:hypothetical protein
MVLVGKSDIHRNAFDACQVIISLIDKYQINQELKEIMLYEFLNTQYFQVQYYLFQFPVLSKQLQCTQLSFHHTLFSARRVAFKTRQSSNENSRV